MSGLKTENIKNRENNFTDFFHKQMYSHEMGPLLPGACRDWKNRVGSIGMNIRCSAMYGFGKNQVFFAKMFETLLVLYPPSLG